MGGRWGQAAAEPQPAGTPGEGPEVTLGLQEPFSSFEAGGGEQHASGGTGAYFGAKICSFGNTSISLR